MKKMVTGWLKRRAKAVLRKFKPTVIAVTGSVGKTSTKNAIALALSPHMKVRTARKNFNNEIGVPLTILGMDSPGRSLFGWLRLFVKSYQIKSFPEVLVLEFGADRPGDIAALCDLAPPDVAVITGISPVHAANFLDLDALIQEKGTLAQRVPKDGLVILNADDRNVIGMAARTTARIKTFGLKSEDAGVRNIEIQTRQDESFEPGEVFALTTADVVQIEKDLGRLKLKNMIGYAPVMACLAAVAVAQHFALNTRDVIVHLNDHFKPEPGRLRPLAGIKGSLIIDDSYNAAPAAMKNGLKILSSFTPGEEFDRRIAALGSMAELGAYSQDEHRLMGLQVAEVADLFVAVGEAMQDAVAAAKEAGMDPQAIEWFATSEEAGRYLDRTIEQGDVVYVKGSQSARMEKVVKDLMAEPLRAKELLVRQEEKWLNG